MAAIHLRVLSGRFRGALSPRAKHSGQGFSQVSSETTGTTGLAGRYAAALLELADAASSLDKVAEDLKSLRSMIMDSADLRRVISSPVLTRAEQVKAMTAICAKASMDDLTGNFVGVIAQNRRLPALQSMIAAYLNVIIASPGRSHGAGHFGQEAFRCSASGRFRCVEKGCGEQNLH